MDIFSVFTLCGGLAFFLYGMKIMSSGLEKMAGGKLEQMIKKLTSNRFKGLILGSVVTVAIQSSSALTVMLVGLVNSGIMKLSQTIAVIMGSNVGTTLTAWITSLAGIESNNIWLKMLKPESFSPLIALIGILLIMVAKKDKYQSVGNIFVGFAILMYGMTLMGNSVEGLAELPQFSEIMLAFKNPILGVLVGAVVTGIVQSSAASVGILQALSMTGNVTYGMAMPIIMGQNIGTCVTALLSSFGVNRNAKRVTVVHFSFNLIGTVLFLLVFYGLESFIGFPFMDKDINPAGIAVVHSIFNVATTIILLPFVKLLEKLAYFVIKDKNVAEQYSFLDDRLLSTPSVAISECEAQTVKMSKIAHSALGKAIGLLSNYDANVAQEVINDERSLDYYEDKLGSFLIKVSNKELSEEQGKRKFRILHTIDDFERLGDHAANLLKTAEEIHEKKITFSEKANEELKVLINAVNEIMEITFKSFENNDVAVASKVEPLEQVVDRIISKLRSRHVKRLQAGECTIQLGFVFSDLLTNLERVSDHCSNIAVAVIEIESGEFDTHEYLNTIKNSGDEYFGKKYAGYLEKYQI